MPGENEKYDKPDWNPWRFCVYTNTSEGNPVVNVCQCNTA